MWIYTGNKLAKVYGNILSLIKILQKVLGVYFCDSHCIHVPAMVNVISCVDPDDANVAFCISKNLSIHLLSYTVCRCLFLTVNDIIFSHLNRLDDTFVVRRILSYTVSQKISPTFLAIT